MSSKRNALVLAGQKGAAAMGSAAIVNAPGGGKEGRKNGASQYGTADERKRAPDRAGALPFRRAAREPQAGRCDRKTSQ
jgi:hypothetical protein